MGKVWVLDTDTKGTGAQMVPFERVLKEPAPRTRGVTVPRKPRPRPADSPQPKPPSRFKVVDALSRQVLAEGADARGAVEALEGARSVVDVSIYRWDSKRDRWRLMTLGERKLLWSHRRGGG